MCDFGNKVWLFASQTTSRRRETWIGKHMYQKWKALQHYAACKMLINSQPPKSSCRLFPSPSPLPAIQTVRCSFITIILIIRVHHHDFMGVPSIPSLPTLLVSLLSQNERKFLHLVRRGFRFGSVFVESSRRFVGLQYVRRVVTTKKRT